MCLREKTDLIYPGATTRQPRERQEEKTEPAGQLLAGEVPSPLGGLRGGAWPRAAHGRGPEPRGVTICSPRASVRGALPADAVLCALQHHR